MSFFANRVIDVRNYLLENIIDFNWLSAYKRTIKLIDFTTSLAERWNFIAMSGYCHDIVYRRRL